MFRIVPDQLRISEGWVRCGQCDEVFDANAQLRTLDETQSLPPAYPAPQGLTAPESMPAAQQGIEGHAALSLAAVTPEAPLGPVLVPDFYDWGPALSPPPATPEIELDLGEPVAGAVSFGALPLAPAHSLQDAILALDSAMEPALDPEPMPVFAAVARSAPTDGGPLQQEQESTALRYSEALDQAADAPLAEELSFLAVRTVPSWGSHGVGKVMLLAFCTLLVSVLGLQVMLSERDRIFAVAPALRPLLSASCSALGCTIAPPRQIEAIAIDSSSFTSVKSGIYLLKLTLKSGAAIDLATPALELTLTDAQDQPLLRRVILAAEFNGHLPIAAGAELAASLPVTVQAWVAAQKISGYKLLAFYP